MSSGGARNRSGPPVDPTSGRSDQRGLVFTALPSQGYDGEAPAFPIPGASDRELQLWAEVWTTPQAAAWAAEPWRRYPVASYVQWSVRCESKDASAAAVSAAIRFADQIGLTPAGLKENGWAIAAMSDAAEPVEVGDDEPAPLRLVVTPGGA